MKRNNKLKNITNKELDKLLNKSNWCDKELLKEHDERLKDGRIQTEKIFKNVRELEAYFQERRKEKEHRQRKAS